MDVLRFETRLSVDAVLRTLRRSLEDNKIRRGIRPRLAGTVDDQNISLHRQRPFSRNLPVLVFNGSVHSHGSGAIIEGRFECHDVMAPMILLFGAVMGIAGVLALARGAWEPDLGLMVTGFFAAVGGAALMVWTPRLVRRFGADDSELLAEEIRQLLS
jgi:hypothetical protein